MPESQVTEALPGDMDELPTLYGQLHGNEELERTRAAVAGQQMLAMEGLRVIVTEMDEELAIEHQIDITRSSPII